MVLRWRDPERGVPLTFRVYAGGPYKFFLDGQLLSSARPIISFGEHAISILITEFDPNQVVLLFAAKYEEKADGKDHQARSTAAVIHFLSAPDDSWKYSCVEPRDDSWQQPGFDDSGWSAMPSREWPPDKEKTATAQSYRAQELLRMGAHGLGVVGTPTKVWIRRGFSVRPSP